MHAVALVFPHQLFKKNPAFEPGRPVYLVEENLFFRQYDFHKQKLILHRAGMKFYEDHLKQEGLKVHYIETGSPEQDIRILVKKLALTHFSQIHIADPADNWLLKRLRQSCESNEMELVIHPSPSFLNTAMGESEFFDQKKSYLQAGFYIGQRKSRKILLANDGSPVGGKWSLDAENRLKYPKKEKPPRLDYPEDDACIREAKKYVEQHFPNNPGLAEGLHLFVSNYTDAEHQLNDFLKHRFEKFGDYEDAIVSKEPVLHHSVLSPLLNSGLLELQQVLDAVMSYAEKHKIPLNSLEGFIRQLIGWREFMRLIYEREGSKQRTMNFWNFKRKIPPSFYNGTTGILPVDITIRKILKTGYCHHIERLMVLGNFMLLCEMDPDEVYRWFMELFIDAYDWVMVPNIYGMSQFADGGMITTKPYISGSNYLMKMSDYEKGEWQGIWDGLFWRFMHVHRTFFLSNPRLGMLVGSFDRMAEEKKKLHLDNAEKYLASL